VPASSTHDFKKKGGASKGARASTTGQSALS
jgi:hypothetical protein